MRTAWLVLALAVLVGGCKSVCTGQRQDKEAEPDLLASGPDLAALAVPPEPAAKAIDAAGGFTEWTRTRKLQLDCVVTVYQPDGSFYLTEHRYEIYPWSNSIRISAQEPLSKFVWQFANGQFSVVEGDANVDVSRMSLSYRDFAEAVLRVTTAPVGFWDKSAEFAVLPELIRVKGLWYRPTEQIRRAEQAVPADEKQKDVGLVEPYWSRVVLFQNGDSSLVDMIWFGDVRSQKFIAVRGYDYRELRKGGVLIPAKIEIFKTNPQVVLGERLVQIDLK